MDNFTYQPRLRPVGIEPTISRTRTLRPNLSGFRGSLSSRAPVKSFTSLHPAPFTKFNKNKNQFPLIVRYLPTIKKANSSKGLNVNNMSDEQNIISFYNEFLHKFRPTSYAKIESSDFWTNSTYRDKVQGDLISYFIYKEKQLKENRPLLPDEKKVALSAAGVHKKLITDAKLSKPVTQKQQKAASIIESVSEVLKDVSNAIVPDAITEQTKMTAQGEIKNETKFNIKYILLGVALLVGVYFIFK